VMVGPQDDLGSQQVVPEVLKRTNYCEQLATSSTIVSLGHVHDPREKCNRPFDTINPLGQYCTYRNV